MVFITAKPAGSTPPEDDVWLARNHPEITIWQTKDGWEVRRDGVRVCTAQSKNGARGLAVLIAKGVCR
jgi:hypothetical protein